MSSTAHHSLIALCRAGKLKEALHILLTTLNPPKDYHVYLQLLQTCILKNALSEGKNVHSFIAHRRFSLAHLTDLYNRLIYLYVKCESLEDARKVFDQMKKRYIFSWNTIVAAYGRHGYSHEAVTLFHEMLRAGFQPNEFTLANVLGACAKIGGLEQGMGIHKRIMAGGFLSDDVVATALVDIILAACANAGDLEQGMDIHQIIKDRGLSSDVRVATALIGMYAKCGRLARAPRIVFKKMQLAGVKPNVVSWSAMIVGYAQKGSVRRALRALKRMELAGIKADSTIFASIVTACAKRAAWKQGIAKTRVLKQGMEIHQRIEDGGIMGDVRVATALVDMYAKCGRIDRARKLFDTMPQRNVVSWAAMIAGYAENGFVENALETLEQMQLAGVNPNSKTFCSILPACVRALKQGMKFEHSSKHNG
ncbi:pentatricopeptide repeat-containing protein At2g13600 [Cryptomeria japonica]|uniref:pentatricopeptide repeat-containing protein At2g13600 n=1 Tax=Cryptomeria japonica TaxID=3369 RepID=UPI0027DA1F32|nr:pentatricopeptide repeat-containing protein At2g13600 [Cryptomeria japonica]